MASVARRGCGGMWDIDRWWIGVSSWACVNVEARRLCAGHFDLKMVEVLGSLRQCAVSAVGVRARTYVRAVAWRHGHGAHRYCTAQGPHCRTLRRAAARAGRWCIAGVPRLAPTRCAAAQMPRSTASHAEQLPRNAAANGTQLDLSHNVRERAVWIRRRARVERGPRSTRRCGALPRACMCMTPC